MRSGPDNSNNRSNLKPDDNCSYLNGLPREIINELGQLKTIVDDLVRLGKVLSDKRYIRK
jgi:hypothetical protein